MLHKIVYAGAQVKSFELAADMLAQLAEIKISGRHVGRLTEEIGGECIASRSQQVASLPPERVRDQTSAPAAAAVVVEVDGGRLHTRAEGQGRGVHDPHWAENKIAFVATLDSSVWPTDPHPEPPACFVDRQRVTRLVQQISSQHNGASRAEEEDTVAVLPLAAPTVEASPAAPAESESPAEQPSAAGVVAPSPAALMPGRDEEAFPADTPAALLPAKDKWRPKRLLRTCVATMADSNAFGKMVANEAYRRGFYAAPRRAFVADGQHYNWGIQERHFSDFEPVTDFIHVLTYVYAAAFAVAESNAAGWTLYERWLRDCWQGRVADVIATLCSWQEQQPDVPTGSRPPPTDPSEVVRKTRTYLENNQTRMAYPRYRCQGIPCMSGWMESLVKEFNYRVKGSEKFWNVGRNAEAILQVRAAVLSEDGRLANHLAQRAGSPFRRHRGQPAGAVK